MDNIKESKEEYQLAKDWGKGGERLAASTKRFAAISPKCCTAKPLQVGKECIVVMADETPSTATVHHTRKRSASWNLKAHETHPIKITDV